MQRFVAMGCQVVCCRICRVFSLVLVLYVVDFFSSGFWLGDAYHITQPPSDGRGAILAMTRALRQVSFLYHHILICICYAALEVLCWLSCQLIMYACCDCFIYYLFSLSPIFYICYCHINVKHTLIETGILLEDLGKLSLFTALQNFESIYSTLLAFIVWEFSRCLFSKNQVLMIINSYAILYCCLLSAFLA